MKYRRTVVRKRKRVSNAERAVLRKIIRLEKLVWKAAQKRDAELFRAIVPPDAVMIFQSGIITQPEYLATMGERTISRYKLHNIRGFMPNATTVILFYRALRLGQESGELFPSNPVIESTTWIKRGKSWVAVLNQETPMHS